MTDPAVVVVMVLLVWPLAAAAIHINRRRRHEELRLWSTRWGRRNPEPPHHRPIT